MSGRALAPRPLSNVRNNPEPRVRAAKRLLLAQFLYAVAIPNIPGEDF